MVQAKWHLDVCTKQRGLLFEAVIDQLGETPALRVVEHEWLTGEATAKRPARGPRRVQVDVDAHDASPGRWRRRRRQRRQRAGWRR